MAAPCYIPTNVEGFQFLYILPTLVIFCLYYTKKNFETQPVFGSTDIWLFFLWISPQKVILLLSYRKCVKT